MKWKHVYLIALCSIGNMQADEEPQLIALSAEQIHDAKIELNEASPQQLLMTVAAPAKITINENQQAHIVAKAPGIVDQIRKNLGDAVAADEVLAILESKEMATAKAAYITALKRLQLAEQTLASDQQLKNKQIISEQDFSKSLLAFKESEINLQVAVQQLYAMGMTPNEIDALSKDNFRGLCNYELKSPIAGVVIKRDITRGELINTDQEVYKIANLDTVWVQISLHPRDLEHVKLGDLVQINPLKQGTLSAQAQISQLSPVVDNETRTAVAIAELPNTSRQWHPGVYVSGQIIVDKIDTSVAVLKEAVHDIDGETCLFIPHDEGFEKRNVVTGRSDGRYVEIISGLDAGTTYAATNSFILKAELGKKDADLD